jgi:plastocyanin
VRGVAVGLAVDGDAADAEFPARADHPDGDLTAVGDQDGVEHGLVADDRLTYSETHLAAAPGPITIALTCDGRAAHDVVVDTPDGPVQVALCGAGGTAAGTVELAAGDYPFFCSVPGHRRSMEGTLTVG